MTAYQRVFSVFEFQVVDPFNKVIEQTLVNGTETGDVFLVLIYVYEAMVRALLDAGANVNQADKDGWTPLSVAAEKGHDGVVEMLRDAGARRRSRRVIKRD